MKEDDVTLQMQFETRTKANIHLTSRKKSPEKTHKNGKTGSNRKDFAKRPQTFLRFAIDSLLLGTPSWLAVPPNCVQF